MIDTHKLKKNVAEAAIAYVPKNEIIGVGTGSTVNFFIDALAPIKHHIKGAVASSIETATRLQKHGIPVFDLNEVDNLSIYVDGADEINHHGMMIKGGGGALTREKIIAAVANQFICIADASKWVDVLGTFPLPVEVIPMAAAYVSRECIRLGGTPLLRQKDNQVVQTDNGQVILDIAGLHITDPTTLESTLNNIAGVVTVGLFARRPADICLLGTPSEIRTIYF